jgi:hypothetical protein
VLGVGSDLMRFFAKDSVGDEAPLIDFHNAFKETHPYPAVNLRAAERLCEAGRLFHGELALGPRAFSARYRCTKTTSELQEDLDYGTFDFIVDGLAAVRNAFSRSVLHLTIEGAAGLSNGSAFAINSQALLTARHCVDGVESSEAITVWCDGQDVRAFKRVLPTSGADVAAIILPSPIDVPHFRIREPALLEPVLTLGFPVLQGLEPALMASAGEIAGITTAYLDGQEYWITTCAMTGGSSGGPVVGADGAVVGVVSALPASEAGVDPGRFGLMASCVEPLKEIAENVKNIVALD